MLAADGDDAVGALEQLADAGRRRRGTAPTRSRRRVPSGPTGALTGEAIADALGALLPEGRDRLRRGATPAGCGCRAPPRARRRHDWLTLTRRRDRLRACRSRPAPRSPARDRKVVCLEADGSAMYTIQALWTQAREGLDVTTVIFNNRSYAILNIELHRVGADSRAPSALDMLDLSRPDLDFVALAKGMGVEACASRTAEEFAPHSSSGRWPSPDRTSSKRSCLRGCRTA